MEVCEVETRSGGRDDVVWGRNKCQRGCLVMGKMVLSLSDVGGSDEFVKDGVGVVVDF